MVRRKIAVLGATGHTGRVVTENLLRLGHEVRAVCRDRIKLDPLVRLGAKPYPVDVDYGVAGLTEAFHDVDAVYTMIPPNFGIGHYLRYTDRIGEHIVHALKQTGTEWVVNLSGMGADLPSSTGPIVGLHRQEERLDRIEGLNVLHLRPAFFLENLLYWIPSLRKTDRIASTFRPDVAIDLVAATDVGRKAAELLDTLDFEGPGFLELVGPKVHRIDEVAKFVGAAIGKPELRYEAVDDKKARKAFVEAGFDDDLAELFVEMERAYNDGRVRLLGKPFRGGITLDAWLKDTFVPAFRKAIP